jgi:hypothetical protein
MKIEPLCWAILDFAIAEIVRKNNTLFINNNLLTAFLPSHSRHRSCHMRYIEHGFGAYSAD